VQGVGTGGIPELTVVRKTGGASDGEVYTAWNDVKSASQKLQATTEDNWPRATTTYEQAAARLRAVLERALPDKE